MNFSLLYPGLQIQQGCGSEETCPSQKTEGDNNTICCPDITEEERFCGHSTADKGRTEGLWGAYRPIPNPNIASAEVSVKPWVGRTVSQHPREHKLPVSIYKTLSCCQRSVKWRKYFKTRDDDPLPDSFNMSYYWDSSEIITYVLSFVYTRHSTSTCRVQIISLH